MPRGAYLRYWMKEALADPGYVGDPGRHRCKAAALEREPPAAW